ncbi:hypothetical protein IT575_00855 [bacterium]|nr:hypothetical protein [bacterium]
MRDINDPASPFAAQYSDWDRWIYEQALAKAGARGLVSMTQQEGGQWFSAVVTKDGFIKPQLAELEEGLGRLSGAVPPSTEHCVNQVSFYGVMSEEMKQQLAARRSELWAEKYPRIPEWLAEKPAIRNMVMPNGDVVTLGPLGSALPSTDASASAFAKPQAYHRYGPDGTLLGQTLIGEMWQALYVPDWTAKVLVEQLKAQRLPSVRRGCTVFEKRDTREIGVIFSYDGQLVATAADLETRSPVLMTEITAQQVKDIHSAQEK